MTQFILTTQEELSSLVKTAVREAIGETKAGPQNPEQWLTRKETAEHLGIGATKLNNIMQTDPSFPKRMSMGRRIFFLRSELDQWRKENR